MKKRIGLLALAGAAAFCGLSAFATDYYVATDGFDVKATGLMLLVR